MTHDPERLPLPVGRSVKVTEYAKDQVDAIDRLVLEQQLPPLLSELRPNDIVVAVKATEIVWTDTVMATGQYQHQARLPYTPGMTYAGVVAWAGAEACKHVHIGQRVAIASFEVGARSSGSYQKWGGCQSYAVAPLSAVRQVPRNWSFEEASCFAYGYDTAYHGLIECGRLRQGESVLIHGASGGVGIPAVHIAKLVGATVIATTRAASKADTLKQLGADHVVVISDKSGSTKRFREDVKAITGGRGVQVVYDGVGGDDITVESMRCCAFGARLLIMGWAATPNVAEGAGKRGSPNANKVPTNLIMMKGLQVIGCPAAISLRHDIDGSMYRRRLKDLGEWLNSGRLPPPSIASVFSLEDVKEAFHARVNSGQDLGATVVKLPDLQLNASSKL